MENKDNNTKLEAEASATAAASQTANSPASTPRSFEVALFEQVFDDTTGKNIMQKIEQKTPLIITATTKEELIDKLETFKMLRQIPKIIREVTPSGSSPNVPLPSSRPQPAAAQPIPSSPMPQQQASQPTVTVQQTQQKHAPRYFRVGDIDVKDDNGKIYQKQWMRVTDAEAENIRVINDKNNAAVNLTGKHIEIKKWVLVEGSTDAAAADVQEMLKP